MSAPGSMLNLMRHIYNIIYLLIYLSLGFWVIRVIYLRGVEEPESAQTLVFSMYIGLEAVSRRPQMRRPGEARP